MRNDSEREGERVLKDSRVGTTQVKHLLSLALTCVGYLSASVKITRHT